ncbi:twin-arginine translocation pathway signal protein [Sphingobium sp. CR28]|uniref:twin-arginine translocation pathway signal protein n=1 Tax=Sphingobium sp. CR28 TaxID=3400272 RepID=UPI003FEF65A0
MSVKTAGLILTTLMAAQGQGIAQVSPAPAAPKPAAPAPSFIPTSFNPPVLVEGTGFKLVPLGPEVVKLDFDAYMSSIEHLQKTFSRSTRWPHPGITDADAMKDMEGEQARFKSRKSFAYAVLTPDGRRERGSVYVSPSPVPGYDAVVRMWVTQADYDAGFDAELYKWVADWVKTDWPFAKVAYPGRAIDWATWDAAIAANAPRKAGS